MGVTVAHPIGNPFASALVKGLLNSSLLDEVWTSFGLHEGSRVTKTLTNVTSIADRRTWLPKGSITYYAGSLHEVIRMSLERSGLRSLLGLSSQSLTDWVYKSFDAKVAHRLKQTDAVYCYEDGAEYIFKRARELGILCFYDLPIPYYKKREEILGSEINFALEPKWKKERKDSELKLSDHIFVASTFTKSSLTEIGVSKEKISIIPYGVKTPLHQQSKIESKEFKILFVGRIEERKGIQYITKSFSSLKLHNASLTLVGFNQNSSIYTSQPDLGIYFKGVVTPFELSTYYAQADLFVFPTLFDGFGLVILEALSYGIPVITTSNSAGPDILTEGVDGFIIPIKNVEALSQKILWCYEHREELRAMRENAKNTAKKFSWENYEAQITQIISKILKVK